MVAAGLMIAAGGIVHAQSTESFTLDGTINDSDGVPAAGLSVEASGFPGQDRNGRQRVLQSPVFLALARQNKR